MSAAPSPTQNSTRRRRGRPSKQSQQTNLPSKSVFAPGISNNSSVDNSPLVVSPPSPTPAINKVRSHTQGRGRPRLRSSICTDSRERALDKRVKGNIVTIEHKTESESDNKEPKKMQMANEEDSNLSAHAAETVQNKFDARDNKDGDSASNGISGDARSNGSVDKEHMPKQRDIFCWTCHRETGRLLACELCPRVFHLRCLTAQPEKEKEPWTCPECEVISENL